MANAKSSNTKSQVLYALEEHKGTPISGGLLAQSLGISRTAVWKAISALRREGYPIDSKPGSGYVLSPSSDRFSLAGIRAALEYDPFAAPGESANGASPRPRLYLYDRLESTNRTATAMALDGAVHGTTVIAREQTAGRGRRGREFYSPKDTGLYLSMILTPPGDAGRTLLLTAAVAVAVARAIDSLKLSPHTCQIKWVNDIYLDGRKICGILTEAISDVESGQIAQIVTGIGINGTTTDFPEAAGPLAGSILPDAFPTDAPDASLSLNALAAAVIHQVLAVSAELTPDAEDPKSTASFHGPPPFFAEYRERSMVIGQKINIYRTMGDAPIAAVAEDIDQSGALIVRRENGSRERLSTGEITIRLS